MNNTVTQRTDYINGMEVTPSTLTTVVQTGGTRHYDPLIGRWHSADPMMQYVSPYMAMGNDWINVIDPFGLEGEPWWKRFLNKILDFLGGGDAGSSNTAVKTDRAKQISYDPEQDVAYVINLDACEVFATPAAGHSSGGYFPTGEVFRGNTGSIRVPASFYNDNSEDYDQSDVINPIHSIQAHHIPQNGYHAEISTSTINSHPTSDMTVKSPGSQAAGSWGLTFEQARLWYQFGDGEPLDVGLNTIDFSRVSMSEMRGKLIEVNLDNPFKHMTNVNDALVYGTIYLQQENGNLFRAAYVRKIKGCGDYYNFDVKWTSPEEWLFRNENTIFGGFFHSLVPIGATFMFVGGKSYPIYLHGTVTIKP